MDAVAAATDARSCASTARFAASRIAATYGAVDAATSRGASASARRLAGSRTARRSPRITAS